MCLAVFVPLLTGCHSKPTGPAVVVYCSVDQPYASKVFAAFEKQTGIHVQPLYDIESSKSVGLAGKLEAEVDHPRCDVWWCSGAFLSVRLANEGILAPYVPPAAKEVQPLYKDPKGYWTGVGVRARVLAVGSPPPDFAINSIEDLADPRLKDRICISRPTAGATGAHLAALYAVWGIKKTEDWCRKLHDNGIALLGGNAEVADRIGAGIYQLGITDNDDITNSQANGGKLTMIVPDQKGMGTLAMPTTVALVKGAPHAELAQKLIDFLASEKTEKMLMDMHFARWSVRGGANTIKAMPVDYQLAARMYPRAQREATALLEGRKPE
jgi:iron(III) transport system substrate-binding protein